MVDRPYTVIGRWPFPLDMLRRDSARAATAADQALIDRMSGNVSDGEIGMKPVSINLIMESGKKMRGRHRPNADRWQSFGWDVTADAIIPQIERERIRQRLRRSMMPVTTPDW